MIIIENKQKHCGMILLFKHTPTIITPPSLLECVNIALLNLHPDILLCFDMAARAHAACYLVAGWLFLLTRDKPCPCPPLTPAGGGGEGWGMWRAPRPHKSLNGSGQQTFTGGTRDLCARRGGVERAGEGGGGARERNTIWFYVVFITHCNMHQTSSYLKP